MSGVNGSSVVAAAIDGMMEGAFIGAQLRAREADENANQWAKTAKRIDEKLLETRDYLVETGSSLDGWKELARGMVEELKNPKLPRRLTDPTNDQGRKEFFEISRQKNKPEWMDMVFGPKGRSPILK